MIKPYWTSEDGDIYHGNVLDVLKELPDESVQMCVTSPPYWGLRDYGNEPQIWFAPPFDHGDECNHVWGDENKKVSSGGVCVLNGAGKAMTKSRYFEASQGQFCQQCGAWKGSLGLEPTPELFIKHMVTIFTEVKRVLRSDGTLWLNIGDSYAGSACGLKNGQGSSDNKTGRANAAQMSRIAGDGIKPKDLVGIPWMLAFALRADGWYLRSDIIWHKPNPMPESCKDRPTKSHEYMFLLTKSAQYYYDCDAIKEKPVTNGLTQGSVGKSWHNHKDDLKQGDRREKDFNGKFCGVGGRNKRSVWTIPTEPTPEAHFATFPKKLVEPCILAGTSEKGCCVECGTPWERVVEKGELIGKDRGGNYKGREIDKLVKINYGTPGMSYESKTTGWKPGCDCGYDDLGRDVPYDTKPCVVMDPFLGSGKTALVAYRHDRKFLGIELSKQYLDDIAIPKITRETRQRKLFD